MSDSPEPEGPPVAPEMSRRSRRRNRSRDAGRDEEQPAATNGMHPPAADAVVIIGAEAERRARHQASDAQVVILGAGAERETSAESGLKDSLWNDIRRPLTAAFIITLCIGIVAELIGGLTGTISAAVAMGLYFVFGITRPKGVRNTEQFADSLYYLGFILTLWALFLAMAPHLHGAGEITSQGIIEKFGIAIVTTFMGMSLRIILIQLRQTSTDQEEEARESIAQYVVQLNQEIGETISQIKQFRHTAISTTSSTAQQFADDLRRLGASSEQAVKDSNTAILKSVQEIMARMDASMQEVIARLQRLDVPTNIFTERLEATADTLSQDIENLRASLNAGTTSFATTLAASATAMGRIKAEIDELQQAVAYANENVKETASASAQTVEGTKRFAQSAAEAAASMQQFRERATELAQMLGQVNQRIDGRAKSYEEEMGGAVGAVKAAVGEFKSGSEAFSKTIVTSANVLRDAIRDVSRSQ